MSSFPILDPQQVKTVTAQPGLVLLDFWQASCAPCRALEPRLAQLADQHPGTFDGYRIDVDADPQTVDAFDVMSIPTVVLLRNGREVARLDGLIRPDDLTAMLHRQQPATTGTERKTAVSHSGSPDTVSSSSTADRTERQSDGCVSGR
jgi:thioredoxin 1